MGFFDRFKKKQEITPAILNGMMDGIRLDLEKVYSMPEGVERDDAIQAAILRIKETAVIVDETLEKVKKNINELMQSGWWATREARSSDVTRLSKGKQDLETKKILLSEMLEQLTNKLNEKDEEQNEPVSE